MALTIWAVLTAAAPDRDTRESIYVYGDDVIVPTAFAANAIEQLESFGLKVNRDKSCTSGFFRESCGMDAYRGRPVTPVRFRTVWSSTPSPESYTSWIAYANSLYDKKYFFAYDYIVGCLGAIYGPIPDEGMHLACPSLREVPDQLRPTKRRTNVKLQKLEWRVRDVKSVSIRREISGWSMLLRYFTEGSKASTDTRRSDVEEGGLLSHPFSVRQYTKRHASMLVYRWR
jgi:hypothetical protein